MKAKSTTATEQEPMGIVISGGSRKEELPTFYAYVWGPDPETPEETGSPRAA